MRRIVLGVTGSIAAYKAAELVRLFIKNGDEVTVIMTEAATKFVAPLTFQTLSRNPVYVDQFAPPVSWKPEHISLAESADLFVVAPATANTIAKIRYGIADNLLTASVRDEGAVGGCAGDEHGDVGESGDAGEHRCLESARSEDRRSRFG